MIRTSLRSFYPRTDVANVKDSKIWSRSKILAPLAKLEGRPSSTVLKHNISLKDMFAKMLAKMTSKQEATALICAGNETLTFGELDKRSDLLAKHLGRTWLQETGGSSQIKQNSDGDAVVLLCTSSPNLREKAIIVLLAVSKLSLTFMAVNPTITTSELCRILQIVKPCLVISDSKCPILSSLEEECFNSQSTLVFLDKIWTSILCDENLHTSSSFQLLHYSLPSWTTVQPELRTVAICMTSGTSEPARAVRIGLRELFNLIHWKKKVLPPTEKDVFSVMFPPWDVNFLTDVLAPILQGNPLAIFDESSLSNPRTMLEFIATTSITRLSLTPPIFTSLIDAASRTSTEYLWTVKIWTISTHTLPSATVRTFVKLFSRFKDVVIMFMYGSVEVVGQVTYELYEDLSDLERKTKDGVSSVGTPICNTKVLIVDEKDKNLPLNTFGEIAISGSCVCSGGYSGCTGGGFTKLGVNGDSSSKSGSRLFRTGDIGKIAIDGSGIKRLYVFGRTSDRITYGSNVIDLQEMRLQLSRMVGGCHVLAYNHGRESTMAIAACVLKGPITACDLTEAMYQNSNEESVESSTIPWIIPVSSIPILQSGRVDCQTIRQMYRNSMIDCDPATWKLLDLLPEHINHVKVLCKAVALGLAVPLDFVIRNFESSIWDMGGSSLDTILMMKFLNINGYPVVVQDIINSTGLTQILDKMLIAKTVAGIDNHCQPCLQNTNFSLRPMAPEDYEKVVTILVSEFTSRYVNATQSQIEELGIYWTSVLLAVQRYGLSFVATNSKGCIVGVIINIPAASQVKIKKPPKEILYSLELFQACKKVSRYTEWRRNQENILQVYFVSLKYSSLEDGEDVLALHQLLSRSMQVARDEGFSSFVVEATNPLIQEICVTLLSLNTLFEFQIRRFKAKDKFRPFIKEANSKIIGVYYSGI